MAEILYVWETTGVSHFWISMEKCHPPLPLPPLLPPPPPPPLHPLPPPRTSKGSKDPSVPGRNSSPDPSWLSDESSLLVTSTSVTYCSLSLQDCNKSLSSFSSWLAAGEMTSQTRLQTILMDFKHAPA